MKGLTIYSILLLGYASYTAHAQESNSAVYDYALLKREYIGKNDIFTVNYKNEAGKIKQIDGFIRVSTKENHITVYSYNAANRNYDLLEIQVSEIQLITKSESQKIVTTGSPKFLTAKGLLKAVGIVLLSAALALLIFRDEL